VGFDNHSNCYLLRPADIPQNFPGKTPSMVLAAASFLMRETVEVCQKSPLYSIFKVKSVNFGGFSHKIRKKNASTYCNLRKILVLLWN